MRTLENSTTTKTTKLPFLPIMEYQIFRYQNVKINIASIVTYLKDAILLVEDMKYKKNKCETNALNFALFGGVSKLPNPEF